MFFFKQKTAYGMRISDWSSDVCSSDLDEAGVEVQSSDVVQTPKARVALDEDAAAKLLKLIDTLEENDDVDAVHANFDIDAEVLERLQIGSAASRVRVCQYG